MYRLVLLLCVFTLFPCNPLRKQAYSLSRSWDSGISPEATTTEDLLFLKSQYFTYRVIYNLQTKQIRRLEKRIRDLKKLIDGLNTVSMQEVE